MEVCFQLWYNPSWLNELKHQLTMHHHPDHFQNYHDDHHHHRRLQHLLSFISHVTIYGVMHWCKHNKNLALKEMFWFEPCVKVNCHESCFVDRIVNWLHFCHTNIRCLCSHKILPDIRIWHWCRACIFTLDGSYLQEATGWIKIAAIWCMNRPVQAFSHA